MEDRARERQREVFLARLVPRATYDRRELLAGCCALAGNVREADGKGDLDTGPRLNQRAERAHAGSAECRGIRQEGRTRLGGRRPGSSGASSLRGCARRYRANSQCRRNDRERRRPDPRTGHHAFSPSDHLSGSIVSMRDQPIHRFHCGDLRAPPLPVRPSGDSQEIDSRTRLSPARRTRRDWHMQLAGEELGTSLLGVGNLTVRSITTRPARGPPAHCS